ncbi:murein DD-endopeptidase MepM/ murein hydrolase activator NlpD [Sphingomonas vulcanisoli]|uniref:Murein DD-endopeptidase MepM/ murein hydrolase activator NlpD n=1 Tax=Sphingomonas vulcanisoli TaxID=1658060 RepID=A0ABX0TSE9_9SPHN|nr:M23 family metallopeptidase [Sphingomonas vulcanisoli]NIJ07664.1 murein DD-endopeptidase MepM/ murein hydrolase activator NlpD [Sphingomonas vulcanisoli]
MRRLAALLALLATGAAPLASLPRDPTPPAWISRQVTAGAIEVRPQIYKVKPGDTLGHVVLATGAGADAIIQANQLQAPYRLRPGQKLAIPGGRFHRVARGESGIAIARAYGVSWSDIAAANHLTEPFILREGDRLLLPAIKGPQPSADTLAARARAFKMDLDDLVTGSEPALAPAAKPVKSRAAAAPEAAPLQPVAEPSAKFAPRFGWPLKGKIVRPFGPLGNGSRNDGVNIATRSGATIAAAADGAIAYASTYPGFGNVVLIRHGSGWITLYGHAGTLLVKRGQAVKRGDPIATVAAGGPVGEPQLHFEIRNGRKAVNPIDWLPAG